MSENTENKAVETEETVSPKKEKKAKVSKKDEEIVKLKEELESEHNLLLRTAAEFDNYKKRTEREKLSVAEFAKANLLKQLLPVLDNIDRAAAARALFQLCARCKCLFAFFSFFQLRLCTVRFPFGFQYTHRFCWCRHSCFTPYFFSEKI